MTITISLMIRTSQLKFSPWKKFYWNETFLTSSKQLACMQPYWDRRTTSQKKSLMICEQKVECCIRSSCREAEFGSTLGSVPQLAMAPMFWGVWVSNQITWVWTLLTARRKWWHLTVATAGVVCHNRSTSSNIQHLKQKLITALYPKSSETGFGPSRLYGLAFAANHCYVTKQDYRDALKHCDVALDLITSGVCGHLLSFPVCEWFCHTFRQKHANCDGFSYWFILVCRGIDQAQSVPAYAWECQSLCFSTTSAYNASELKVAGLIFRRHHNRWETASFFIAKTMT